MSIQIPKHSVQNINTEVWEYQILNDIMYKGRIQSD